MKTFAAIATVCLFATPALADLNVAFLEGAPKDRFVLTNAGACDLAALEVTLDLAESEAGLIFDVTGSGPGVEVFQPFQVVSGQEFIARTPVVSDGDSAVSLSLGGISKGQIVAFTIDVDDTGGAREITVSDSELRGATVTVTTADGSFSSAFGDTSEAKVTLPDCPA